jgi:hypothetical protein
MLSRRTWCARAPLALLAGLPLVTLLALLALLAGLPLVTPMALLAGPPLVTLLALLALLAGLPLRTLLSRGPLLRSWGCVATANKYG